MGKAKTQEEAVNEALQNTATILLQNPSLIVELLDLNQTGHHYEAHIRLMAVSTNAGGDDKGRIRKKEIPSLEFKPKSLEHFRSGQPFEWRPVGMKHDEQGPFYRFGNATYGGNIPDIPIQDIEMYKKAGWDDETIRNHVLSQKK